MNYEVSIQRMPGSQPRIEDLTAPDIKEAVLTAIHKFEAGIFRSIREVETDKYYRIWWSKRSFRIIPLRAPWGGKEFLEATTHKLPPDVVTGYGGR